MAPHLAEDNLSNKSILSFPFSVPSHTHKQKSESQSENTSSPTTSSLDGKSWTVVTHRKPLTNPSNESFRAKSRPSNTDRASSLMCQTSTVRTDEGPRKSGSKAGLGKGRASVRGVVAVTTEYAHLLTFFPLHLFKFRLCKSGSSLSPKQEARSTVAS